MKKIVLERIKAKKFLTIYVYTLNSTKIVSGLGVGTYFLKKRLGDTQYINQQIVDFCYFNHSRKKYKALYMKPKRYFLL
jgi:hypothetical protein